MLSTTVHVQERLFVKQDFQSSSVETFLQDFHRDHVLIDTLTGFQEEWAEFELIDRDLVVSGLYWDSEFQKFVFNFFQDVFDFVGNLAIVMVRELLMLGWKLSA